MTGRSGLSYSVYTGSLHGVLFTVVYENGCQLRFEILSSVLD